MQNTHVHNTHTHARTHTYTHTCTHTYVHTRVHRYYYTATQQMPEATTQEHTQYTHSLRALGSHVNNPYTPQRRSISIGYTMRMRGYRIYTTEGEARTCIFDDPNPNCITGLYQNAEAFPFPIGSSRAVQCN